MNRNVRRPALTLVELLVVIALIGVAVALLLPNVRSARTPARRNQCQNNLKQVAFALQAYEQQHGALPPAYTVDADGKPLHSWRTLILPYLEEKELYESIDLTKPWDDPVNATAFNTPVSVYQCPSTISKGNLTTYLAVVTPNSCLRPADPRKTSDITDPSRQTMLVIEADETSAVPWMSPKDADEALVLQLGDDKHRAPHGHGMNAAFVDGSVQFLLDELPAGERRALISIAGNDEFKWED